MKNITFLALAGSWLLAIAGMESAHAAVDAAQAQALMTSNKCGRCHAAEKTKSGPSLKKIAEKYRGCADGVDKIIANITTAPTVKMDDGTEEEHMVIKTKDPEKLKNLAQWILER